MRLWRSELFIWSIILFLLAIVDGSTLSRGRLPFPRGFLAFEGSQSERDELNLHSLPLIPANEESKLHQMLSSKRWKLVCTSHGVTVYEQRMPGSSQLCIRAEGDLNAPMNVVLEIFRKTDIKLIRDYNPSYDDGRDIVPFSELGNGHKISWAVSKAIFPVCPREFITDVRYLRMPDGAIAVLSEGLESHDRAPTLRPSSVRGRVITAIQLVAPLGERRCRFISVAQVDLGGAVPAWLTNSIARRDAPFALRRLEAAAKRCAGSPAERRRSVFMHGARSQERGRGHRCAAFALRKRRSHSTP